jgi:uncharacterized membrane protein
LVEHAMTRWLIAYGVTAAVFLVLDLIWLSSVGPAVYRPALKELFADRVHLAPAMVFYLIYIAGVMVLAVHPGMRAQSVLTAAMLGATLGLVAYAAYDLTNMATLKAWPLRIAVMDIAWGTLLSAVAAGLGCFAALKFGPLG